MLDEHVAAFNCRDSSRRRADSCYMLLIFELKWMTLSDFCGLYVLTGYCLPVPIIFFLEAIDQSALRFIAQIRLHLTDPLQPALCLFHPQ